MPHEPNTSRSIGSQMAIVDDVEETLDQVGGLLLFGLRECHVIIMTDCGIVRNSWKRCRLAFLGRP